MIVTVSELMKEHEAIERELIELDTIIHSSVVNYPNLLHVLKRLKAILDPHEEKEELFFNALHKKGFTIPVKKITFEHGKLRRDLGMLLKVLHSGNDGEMHTVLFKYGKDLTENIRKHMADEDWILYALPKRS
ncbi:MAG: hemerythrin domain-containing protein [Nanoarchaeota archaeon]